MMPMFLTVYLSNNDQHFTEVPITPDTVCRDVVELCKEPGEIDCHLAEMWRGSERPVGDGERMLDLLQGWGPQRAEVRFLLRHNRASNHESGSSRGTEHKKNGLKGPVDRRMENGVTAPCMDMTLAELQEMAARQQQQIDAQQQLLASKEQRLRFLKQQDQRKQQQALEQEKLQRLRENVEKQEIRLKKVRALKGQVEQKRLSNGKLVEEIEQMNSLFQQKQRELVVAVSKVEELSRQLEILKNCKMDPFNNNQSSVAELDSLYKELQLRNKLNQEQNAKLQQQRDNLNKRNQEVATMDKRVNELRERLWKKKAALQQRENLPNGFPVKEKASKDSHPKVSSDIHIQQQTGGSRVAAVGPYIQSSTMPRGQLRHEQLVKPPFPDGTSTLPAQERTTPELKSSTGSMFTGVHSPKVAGLSDQSISTTSTDSTVSHGLSSTLPRTNTHTPEEQEVDTEVLKRGGQDRKVRPFSMFESSELPATELPPTALRKNQSSEDLVRDAQIVGKVVKVPPPVPNKPRQVNLPPGTQIPYGKQAFHTSTFPGKVKGPIQLQTAGSQSRLPLPSSQSNTLPLPSKQEAPPAATVRPFTPELAGTKDANGLQKPQSGAASYIYKMYLGEVSQQGVQGALSRSQNRNHFVSVYGKPVISGGSQVSQNQHPENPYMERPSGSSNTPDSEVDQGTLGPGMPENQETERIPRPLSPTKLLPFISNPYRHQSDVDLEALRKKLYNAPRPLKKRSSITEPEGPAGPNIQKLLYQKTTLAAMETTASEPVYQPSVVEEDKESSTILPATVTEITPLDDVVNVAPVETLLEPLTVSSAVSETKEDDFVPPPPPPHPAPRPEDSLLSTQVAQDQPLNLPAPPPETFLEEFPPYPPPPYPSSGAGPEQESLGEDTFNMEPPEVTGQVTLPPGKRTNLRKAGSERIDHNMRVKFNPLALLLDSSLEGEYDLVQRIIYEVEDPSQPNDEGITALHNAVCAGHTEIVKFLVQFGVNVNAADSDGWTPLHCAASCNNVQVCKFLVESGAAVFAMTYSDMQTAADKCEEMEDGYTQCSQFLYGVQEKMGIMNRGVVYGLWDYEKESSDELCFQEGDCMTIVRREDEDEVEWWWARIGNTEGYIPRNLLGLYPRIKPRQRSLA
ncbi:apoptosis-stimulating of p53 protein 2a isoform X2 [Alosa alosa]|uniref:apoptosis-stimulating of p53 protein 2a isoform X2 n=1 Tax=Alosa alosa TaxID=278164 RepID=UPI0020150880|nr:apoptosis-stimulating of p53 protein 2a isoform X2 [Alosa alosa]